MFISPHLLTKHREMWVTYRIDVEGWCAYVGYCELRAFGMMPDAMRNPEFAGLLKNEDFMSRNPQVSLINFFDSEEQAFNTMYVVASKARPVVSYMTEKMVNRQKSKVKRPVRRIDKDGNFEEFESVAEACREYNLHPSNMSIHLSGLSKSVRGMQFEYV